MFINSTWFFQPLKKVLTFMAKAIFPLKIFSKFTEIAGKRHPLLIQPLQLSSSLGNASKVTANKYP
jgi:hypothetical protein